MIHGECVLQIQVVSSTMYSPLNPYICMMTSVCRVLSAPVAIPVSNSKYFLKKELPDLGHDENATLFPTIASPSRNLVSPSNYHACSCHKPSSLDLKRAKSFFRLIVFVPASGRITIVLSR